MAVPHPIPDPNTVTINFIILNDGTECLKRTKEYVISPTIDPRDKNFTVIHYIAYVLRDLRNFYKMPGCTLQELSKTFKTRLGFFDQTDKIAKEQPHYNNYEKDPSAFETLFSAENLCFTLTIKNTQAEYLNQRPKTHEEVEKENAPFKYVESPQPSPHPSPRLAPQPFNPESKHKDLSKDPYPKSKSDVSVSKPEVDKDKKREGEVNKSSGVQSPQPSVPSPSPPPHPPHPPLVFSETGAAPSPAKLIKKILPFIHDAKGYTMISFDSDKSWAEYFKQKITETLNDLECHLAETTTETTKPGPKVTYIIKMSTLNFNKCLSLNSKLLLPPQPPEKNPRSDAESIPQYTLQFLDKTKKHQTRSALKPAPTPG